MILRIYDTTTSQLRVGYDTTHYLEFDVTSTGSVTINQSGTTRGRITSGGILAWGTTFTTGGAAGDVTLANAASLRSVDAAGTSTYPVIGLNSNNSAAIGGGYAGSIFPEIIGMAAASLPAGSASRNGRIAIDTTNHRFVFYDGGARYYVTGTSF